MKFDAIKVTFDYNEYGILIILFESQTHYLMIQYKESHTDLDVALGMDTYHIERDDQGYGGYGGVKRWTLNEDSVFIELSEKGEKILGTDTVEITFDLDQDMLILLREKLEISLGK